MNEPIHEWSSQDIVAGELCLDFTNTVGDRSKTRDVEWLPEWDTLIKWAVAVDALDKEEAQYLRKAGKRDPAAAAQSLQTLRTFRSMLFRIVSAIAAGHAPPQEDLERMEVVMRGALRAAHLSRQGQTYRWTVRSSDVSMKTPLARIALSTLQLLQSNDLARLRECQRCSWLFLDRSKSRRRRWCRAAACGNRARVARHYAARAT